jgi:hypothetical protein
MRDSQILLVRPQEFEIVILRAYFLGCVEIYFITRYGNVEFMRRQESNPAVLLGTFVHLSNVGAVIVAMTRNSLTAMVMAFSIP